MGFQSDFWSEFIIRFYILTMNSIKLDPNSIETIQYVKNWSNSIEKVQNQTIWIKMVKKIAIFNWFCHFWLILSFSIDLDHFWSFNWHFNQQLVKNYRILFVKGYFNQSKIGWIQSKNIENGSKSIESWHGHLIRILSMLDFESDIIRMT